MTQDDREVLAHANVRVYAKKYINGQGTLDQLRHAIEQLDAVLEDRPVTPEAA